MQHCNKIYCFIEHMNICIWTTHNSVQQSTHMNRLIIKHSNCNTIAAIKNSMQLQWFIDLMWKYLLKNFINFHRNKSFKKIYFYNKMSHWTKLKYIVFKKTIQEFVLNSTFTTANINHTSCITNMSTANFIAFNPNCRQMHWWIRELIIKYLKFNLERNHRNIS